MSWGAVGHMFAKAKNDLPADIVDFRSLQSFKKSVSTVDLSKYLSDTYS